MKSNILGERDSKKGRKNILFLVAFLFICSIIFLALSFLAYRNSQDEGANVNLINNENEEGFEEDDLYTNPEIQKYRAWIREKGGEQAHEDFSDYMINKFTIEGGERHGYAHYFGDALFLEKGFDGLLFCDNMFDYGCIHGFLGKLIEQEGAFSLYRLREVCNYENESLGYLDIFSCLHGSGHGLLGEFGYDEAGLLQALKVCEEVFDDYYKFSDRETCHSGVFMEYNVRIMISSIGEGNANMRPYNNDIYAPCMSLEEHSKFQRHCWSQLSIWWSYVLPAFNSEEKYYKIFSLCQNLPKERSKWIPSCAEGLGASIMMNFRSSSQELLVDMCSLFNESDSTKRCIINGIVHGFASQRISEEDAYSICGYFKNKKSESECLKKASDYYEYYKKEYI